MQKQLVYVDGDEDDHLHDDDDWKSSSPRPVISRQTPHSLLIHMQQSEIQAGSG